MKILGFSKGACGRIDGPLYLLCASGSDIVLHEGDEVEMVITSLPAITESVPLPTPVEWAALSAESRFKIRVWQQDAQRLAALTLVFMDASFDATVPEMFDEFRRLAEKLAPQPQAEQAHACSFENSLYCPVCGKSEF